MATATGTGNSWTHGRRSAYDTLANPARAWLASPVNLTFMRGCTRPLVSRLRTLFREMLLRGPVARWWSLRQCRRVEASYLRHLAGENRLPPASAAGTDRGAVHRPGQPLRRLLFIGDCMWEPEELFPELRKICALRHHDLHRALTSDPQADPREVVRRSVETFTKVAADGEPDVILFYARPALLSDAVFDVIRRRWSCPLLGLNLDDRAEFFPHGVLATGNDDYARWAPKFDLNLTNAWTALDWYRRRGAAVRYFPPGFHLRDEYREPPARAEYEWPFSFVGSWKPERGRLAKQLAAAGVRVSLFGRGWPDSQWVDQAPRVYRRSQLNLGISFALPSAGLTTTKARDVECPGVGACYLTTYNWELPLLFDVGREILCYREFAELIEVQGWYARRPEECLRIAQAAHRRGVAEHTWEQRFRKLFSDLGFKA